MAVLGEKLEVEADGCSASTAEAAGPGFAAACGVVEADPGFAFFCCEEGLCAWDVGGTVRVGLFSVVVLREDIEEAAAHDGGL